MIRTTHAYKDALNAVAKFRETADPELRLEWVVSKPGFSRQVWPHLFCRVINKAGEIVREFAVKE